MIGNDDIGGLGLAARTVNEAGRAEEWAFTAQAIVARGGDHPARQRAVVDLQAVDVVVGRLLNKGKQGGKGRSLRFCSLPTVRMPGPSRRGAPPCADRDNGRTP